MQIKLLFGVKQREPLAIAKNRVRMLKRFKSIYFGSLACNQSLRPFWQL